MSTFWKLIEEPSVFLRAGEMANACCLVSDIPPCLNYSGGIFVDQMLRALDGQVRDAFIVINPELRPNLSSIAGQMEIVCLEKSAEWYDPERSAAGIRAAERTAAKRVSEEILPRLLEFASRKKTKVFWVLLEGQAMIRLAHLLIQATSVPVIVQVMDPPLNWFTAHNLDDLSQIELFEQYEAILRSASCCACGSWAMAELYADQFLVRCVPVIPSIPAALAKQARAQFAQASPFRIGFSGQIYAADEWHRLLRVLDSIDWKIGERPVEIHAFTELAQGTPGLNERRSITFGGWVESTSELIELLHGMDLLYLPYRFSPRHSEEARLCFPSKLTTYLAAGAPVLIHAPAYASPVRFLQQNRAAFVCDTPNDDALRTTLLRIMDDPQEYQSVAENGRAAFDTFLTQDSLSKAVRKALTAGPHPRRKFALPGLSRTTR